ncbi:MAG: hypothetical protein RR387_04730 [Clostridiales bacterium]
MADNTIPQLHNVRDLKMLLERYGGLLTPENRQMVVNLLSELEKGADPATLSRLAGQMQQSAAKQQQKMPSAASTGQNSSPYNRGKTNNPAQASPTSTSARSPEKLPPRRRSGFR